MAARNLLHISKLDEFKLWLDIQGIQHRPGRGHYEVLQVQVVKPFWCCIFWREHMPEHFTVEKRLVNTVMRFLHHKWNDDPPGTITTEETAPCPTEPPWMS